MTVDNAPVPLGPVTPGSTFRFPADDRVFMRVGAPAPPGRAAYLNLADGVLVDGPETNGVVLQPYKAVPVD